MIRRLAVVRVPMVQDYGFLIRFMVLFTVWGSIAYTFRLYVNLSWTGLILSGLFAVASVMVFVGFWTRSAMVGLGLVVLSQAYVMHNRVAVGAGILPLISAILPLGGLYSLDRYLQLRRTPLPYVPRAAASAPAASPGLRAIFVALVAFMIGGPAYNEIFHHHSKLFRSWDMYHTVGKELVILEFYRPIDGARQHVDYIQVLGHSRRYSGLARNRPLRADMRIMGAPALDGLIARVCGIVDDPASLRLDAKIATLKRGWWPLVHGDEMICSAQGKPLVKAAAVPNPYAAAERIFDVE